MNLKLNLLFFFVLIIIINIVSSSTIKIPFKIIKYNNSPNEYIEKTVEDMTFYFNLLSLIEIGNPPQKIDTSFDLKSSNFYITYNCRNCSTFYSYKKSKTFSKIETSNKPIGFGNLFYANETFYFYDGINNNQKIIENMLIYLPELNDEKKNNRFKNCMTIGLKFPDYSNNNFQKTFIQQLKIKNIFNRYFWTMIFYDSKNKNDYDGAFILGDILDEYYPNIDKDDYSQDKVVHIYTENIKKGNDQNSNNNLLEWGIKFDEIYYELSRNNQINVNEKNDINNIIYINGLITEFDFNINAIFSNEDYSRNIQRDFFNFYFNKNICKYSHIRGGMYMFIYCKSENFTEKDLERFPPLKFKNKILRYIFILDYNDLFSLTNDKKFYIFNIMIVNVYKDLDDEGKWILGLPFWRKYQFIFDTDNKLIYFYNKKGNFINEQREDKNDYKDNNINKIINKTINDNEINNENDTEITNNQRIINDNKNSNNYVNIKIENIILFIIIFVFLILLFFILLLLVKKLLNKNGFVLMRVKMANELNDDFDYSLNNKDINFIKKDNNSNKQECEMQIK